MSLNPGKSYVYAFFHNVTKLSSHLNFLPTAPILQSFYSQNFSPHLGPGQSVDNANPSPEFVVMSFAQIVFYFVFGDGLLGIFSDYFSTNFGNISLKFSNPHFPGVLDNFFDSIALELN